MQTWVLSKQPRLCDWAEELCFEDKFPFLILLGLLKRLIVRPSNELVALPTPDIPHDMLAGCHISLFRLARYVVNDGVEEICLSMLAAKALVIDVSLRNQEQERKQSQEIISWRES